MRLASGGPTMFDPYIGMTLRYTIVLQLSKIAPTVSAAIDNKVATGSHNRGGADDHAADGRRRRAGPPVRQHLRQRLGLRLQLDREGLVHPDAQGRYAADRFRHR